MTAPKPAAASSVDQACQTIREAIQSGLYPGGTWIRETVVAEKAKVSRTSVRQALNVLAAEGFVELHPNRGATVVDWTVLDDGQMGFSVHWNYPPDALVRVGGTGAACLLMHRTALEKVAAQSGDVAAPWFRETAVGAPLSLMGEDMTFCLRCAAAGIPVHVHTGVKAGHMKTTMLI